MSEFTHFSPRAPRSVTVAADSQTMVSKRTSDHVYTVMYITNNSDVPVYLGFTGPNDPNGNAAAKAGITVFPKSTFVFDDPVPTGCTVWATCESGEAILGIQE